MLPRLVLALMCFALVATATSAPAIAAVAGCQSATSTKAKDRKPGDGRDKKRPASQSLGQGCIGCIVPLDGISSTMALRPHF
jgi:hypothetical protein